MTRPAFIHHIFSLAAVLSIGAASLCISAREYVKANPSDFKTAGDFDHRLRKIDFKYTCGITDPANHQYSDNIRNWCDWSGWEDGKWEKDKGFLDALFEDNGFKMPDFSLRTKNDKDYPLAEFLDEGQKRQPTHTTEHTIYAIPGDPIILYPYYEMERQARDNYKIKFTHWYDWKTGTIPTAKDANGNETPLLDFLINREGIYKTDNHGYFGLPGLDGYDFFISSVDDWHELCQYVNSLKVEEHMCRVKAIITNDLDFAEHQNDPEYILANNPEKPFMGKINGNGHLIKNLKQSGEQYVGLIGHAAGGCEIRNLVIDESCEFVGNKISSSLIGRIANKYIVDKDTEKTITDNIIISNIYTKAKVSSIKSEKNPDISKVYAIGGLIGEVQSGHTGGLSISNCRISGEILPVGFDEDELKYVKKDDGKETGLLGNEFTGIGAISNATERTLTSIIIDAKLPTMAKEIYPYAYVQGSNNPSKCYFKYKDSRGFNKAKDTETENLAALGGEFALVDGIVVPVNHVDGYDVTIGSAYGWIDFCKYANNKPDASVIFDRNIDFDGIVYDANQQLYVNDYRGLINGNGYGFYNFCPTGTDCVAIIKVATGGCTIRNLYVDETCEFTGGNRTAALIGKISKSNNADITISNVYSKATITSINTGAYGIGGFIGQADTYDGKFCISNCRVSGSIKPKDGVAASNQNSYTGLGAIDPIKNCILTSIIIDADLPDEQTKNPMAYSQGSASINNCWFKHNSNRGFSKMQGSESDYLSILGEEFELVDDIARPKIYEIERHTPKNAPLTGKYATTATFLAPEGEEWPKDGYLIAADFSQSFMFEHNTSKEDDRYSLITEPAIQFRHIFNIKDGREFAEKISATYEANNTYADENTRFFASPNDRNLAVRLKYPYPTEINAESDVYYKSAEGEYLRVGKANIYVYKKDDSGNLELIQSPENKSGLFEFIADYEGYAVSGNKNNGLRHDVVKFNRMIGCDSITAGKYGHLIVKLVGCDTSGNEITFGNNDEKLVVEQFDFSFQNKKKAHIVRKKRFYPENVYKDDAEFKEYWPDYLEHDEDNTKLLNQIHFDEYCAFLAEGAPKSPDAVDESDYLRRGRINIPKEEVGTADAEGEDAGDSGNSDDDKYGYWFKWPMQLESGTYAFGYDMATAPERENRYEFNEYLIATHTDLTPWHGRVTDDNKYDINYYETIHSNQKPTSGFFYYVNAASDPGMICDLKIKNDLCPGATVKVSAWLMECSPYYSTVDGYNQTANLAFHFYAVKKRVEGNDKLDGSKVDVHTFITGPMRWDCGEWMHIFFEFTPRIAEYDLKGSEIDYYILELYNNAENSNGADYAVDDIRIYVSNPEITAVQKKNICKPNDNGVYDVKVSANFLSLLQALEEKESKTEAESEEVEIYYTFIDKEAFDAKYDANAEDQVASGRDAYNAAVVRYDYEMGGEDREYGKLVFSTHFESNPEYTGDEITSGHAFREGEGEDRCIVFDTKPKDYHLVVGKKYYVSMVLNPKGKSGDESSEFKPEWDDFNIKKDCTLQCVFTVEPTSVIKIDGEIVEFGSQTEYCANMQPTIQVNLKGIDSDGNIEVVEYNAYFDWYDGNMDAYNEEMFEQDIPLADVLDKMRICNPTGSDVDKMKTDDIFTKEMLAYIKELVRPSDDNILPKLTLYRKSYTFPPLQLPADVDSAFVSVLAIPIYHETEDDNDKTYTICTIPTQVSLKVKEKSPLMRHGLADLPYPARMQDVPIRISIDQLSAATKAATDGTYKDHAIKLNVPVREKQFSGVIQDETSMRIKTDDKKQEEADLILVWTDDPEYVNLGCPEELPSDPKERPLEEKLLTVGEITGINVTESTDDTDVFDCVFDSDFIFKEGYSYTFRFSFEEADEGRNQRCPGQETFTIKVIPKYLKWIGVDNLNFNNDENWRRVSSEEVYAAKDEESEYFTDGSNESEKAFAPLDFTRVIIPETSTTPHLFKTKKETIHGIAGEKDGVFGFNSEAEWSSNPSDRLDDKYVAANYAHAYDPDKATTDVEYDMAAFELEDHGVYCRPWYDNTCDQIHFLPNSEIIGQGHLEYDRAWVDMEFSPLVWHLAASPLKQAFSGDLYLPTKGARQKTPLFDDITYSDELNNRFAPAVYQRSYRTNKAMVYKLDGDPENVAIDAGWSNVYNEVLEEYGAEKESAFSILIDPTDATPREDGDKVLFRLPKNDKTYTYKLQDDFDGSSTSNEKTVDVTRNSEDGQYALNEADGEVYARALKDSRFFLVGNPLMSHLDMKSFLKKNESLIKPKYWNTYEGFQNSVSFGEFNPEDPAGTHEGVIAPLQGFFVQLRDDVTLTPDGEGMVLLKLKYGPEMATIAPSQEPESTTDFTVTSLCDGHASSKASVRINPNASNTYDSDTDVEILDNTKGLEIPAIVYVLSGNMATAATSRTTLEGAELGIIRRFKDQKVTLRFDGVCESDSLAIYNAADSSYTDLHEGMAYDAGTVQSGLFIVKRVPESVVPAANLAYAVNGREVTVMGTDCDSSLNVSVADIEGRSVLTRQGEGNLRFSLDAGVYVIAAKDEKASLTVKIMIK